MTQKSKIIHVEFTTGPNAGKHFYFGSVSSIFGLFSSYQIDAHAVDIYKSDFNPDNPFITNTCIIRESQLIRKKGNRSQPGTCFKKAQKIDCFSKDGEFVKTYESAKQASEELCIARSNIYSVIHGNSTAKRLKGFYFKKHVEE